MRTNQKPEADATQLEQLYMLLQPTRQKIISTLRNSDRPMYIREIAEKIGESERVTSFHLATLAAHQFVAGEFKEIEAPTHHSNLSGRAAKFYHLTPEVDRVAKLLATNL